LLMLLLLLVLVDRYRQCTELGMRRVVYEEV
jgi:hypothetical protein